MSDAERLRSLLIDLRRGHLLQANAIGDYLDLPRAEPADGRRPRGPGHGEGVGSRVSYDHDRELSRTN